MGELRSISTRADITTTSFINEYSWGDLKANPVKLLQHTRCFCVCCQLGYAPARSRDSQRYH